MAGDPDRGVKIAIPRLTAKELIALTLDPGSFESWDQSPTDPSLGEEYANTLATARERTGLDEAVLTGEGTVEGKPVAVVVGEFGFLAGSIGVSASDRIVAAFRRATAEGLPLLAAPVSGGTRMQEGTIAFSRMVDITAAVVAHRRAGLLYLVYLRHPTTGGVFASWGSLGHITVAEPKALIGFLGPKVYEALHGESFPAGVQSGENLRKHGLVDAVLAPHHLRGLIAKVLHVITPVGQPDATRSELNDAATGASEFVTHGDDPWNSVMVSRMPGRPGLRTLLRVAAHDIIGLHGTGRGESDATSMVALARIGTHGVVVVGLDRHAQSFEGPLGPGALRQARRGMALAAELGLPLVTVIDTPGAALSREAEEGGLGREIAGSLAALIELPVPTVSVILGQGTGGAAIALFPADRVIAARHGWFSPLPPEGASVIRHGHVDDAPAMARAQGISAPQLRAAGLVDELVDELPDASDEPAAFCRRVGEAIERQLILATLLHREHPDPRDPARSRVRRVVHPDRAVQDTMFGEMR